MLVDVIWLCVCVCLHKDVTRDGIVGMATRYGLDVSGFQHQCGQDFPHPSVPPVGPTYTMGSGSFPGGKAAGAWS